MTDIKQLHKEFERYAYGQSLQSALTEFLDWTLLPFKKWDSAELQNHTLETYQTTGQRILGTNVHDQWKVPGPLGRRFFIRAIFRRQ